MTVRKEKINRELYGFLKSHGYKPQGFIGSGESSGIPEKADFFQFDFTYDGKNYGKVSVSIDGNSNLIVYSGDDVENSPKASSSENISFTSLKRYLSRFRHTRGLKSFQLSDTDDLEPDMKKREHDRTEGLNEGYYPINKRSSYNDSVPATKIILQHSKVMEEGDQRYRSIEKIFVENIQGERFLLPTNKPGLARVYARHISEGGTPYDERGKHITDLCEEYAKMAGFVRATRNKQFNESAQPLINEGFNHYTSLRETLHKMSNKRGYTEYFTNYKPSLTEDDSGTDISEMFMQASLDPRIESVMPILGKLNKNISENILKPVEELEEWADRIIEGQVNQSRTEGEATLAKIAMAGDDGYEMIYDGLTGLLGTEAQIILQDMYDDISREHRLHPDDDSEQIQSYMMDQIESDYGQQGVAEVSQQTLQSYRKRAAKQKNDALDVADRPDTDDATWVKNMNIASKRKDGIAAANKRLGVAEGLNEFAPNGFNGDDGEEFNPRMAKMAYDEGVVKGVSLADGATLEMAMKINYWHTQHGGMYKQYFAKGFKAGRMNKVKHDNKQYNLNLKLMKDGSIRHGEQGVAEESHKIADRYDPADFDAMVKRVGQKAKQNPADIENLAKRLHAAMKADEKKEKEVKESGPAGKPGDYFDTETVKTGPVLGNKPQTQHGLRGKLVGESQLEEMDAQGYKGTRDSEGSKGEGKATPIKAKDMAKKGEKALDKAMADAHKKDVKEGQEDLEAILRIVKK